MGVDWVGKWIGVGVSGCGLVGGGEWCGVRVSLTLTIEACVCFVCALCMSCNRYYRVSTRLVHSHRISRRWEGYVYVVCSSSVVELHCVMYFGSLCV